MKLLVLLPLIGLLLTILFIWGCAGGPKPWSKARPDERRSGFFVADAAYYQSGQYHSELQASADTVTRLRAQVQRNATK